MAEIAWKWHRITRNQIWQISLCNSILVPSFRRIFVRTNLFLCTFLFSPLFSLPLNFFHFLSSPFLSIPFFFLSYGSFLSIPLHSVSCYPLLPLRNGATRREIGRIDGKRTSKKNVEIWRQRGCVQTISWHEGNCIPDDGPSSDFFSHSGLSYYFSSSFLFHLKMCIWIQVVQFPFRWYFHTVMTSV